MKKEITIGQALAIAIGLITTIVTGWVTMTNKVTSLETRVEYLERSTTKLEQKLDAIEKNTVSILVALERKQDRN